MISTFTLKRGLVAILSPKRKEVEETTGGKENSSKKSKIHARIFGYFTLDVWLGYSKLKDFVLEMMPS